MHDWAESESAFSTAETMQLTFLFRDAVGTVQCSKVEMFGGVYSPLVENKLTVNHKPSTCVGKNTVKHATRIIQHFFLNHFSVAKMFGLSDPC